MRFKAIFKNLSVVFLSFLLAKFGFAQTVGDETLQHNKFFTQDSLIAEVIDDPALAGFGRLLFPTNPRFFSGNTLGELELTWYNNINPKKTVEIVNYLKEKSLLGEKVFYDIYTKEQKDLDPRKENTGLFFFRGESQGKVAICNAGGGFMYVGAMHDSFPHALELSKKGFNAFALIYRPGAQTACEDLAAAIAFIFKNAKELQIDPHDYSLWGGSAGGRMIAYVGSLGTEYFGQEPYPKPAAIIMQYTGHSEYSRNDPPTFACVGTKDWIADYKIMQERLRRLQNLGIPTEFHAYSGLGHGFGLGEGTKAFGWLDAAVNFWQKQIKT